MDPIPELILLKLSLAIWPRDNQLSFEFDRWFALEGFRYIPARQAHKPEDLTRDGDSNYYSIPTLLEDLVRSGYPDYVIKAQEFFRVKAPHLLDRG